MKKKIRNGLLIVTSLVMVLAFTSCGCSSSQEPASKTGGVVYCEAGELLMVTTASEILDFDIENAEMDAVDSVEYGDLVEVEYTGEITDGDTSGCTVSKVTVVPSYMLEAQADEATVDNEFAEEALKAAAAEAAKQAADNVKKEIKKDTEITIAAVSDVVYVTANDVAVRSGYDVKAKRIGTVNKGKKLSRTGKVSNGWSRVKFDGKDAYINGKYLSTKAPGKKDKTKKTKKKTKTKKTKEKKGTVTMEGTIKKVDGNTIVLDTATSNEFTFNLEGAEISTDIVEGNEVTVVFKGTEDQPGKLLKIY